MLNNNSGPPKPPMPSDPAILAQGAAPQGMYAPQGYRPQPPAPFGVRLLLFVVFECLKHCSAVDARSWTVFWP